ncbi:MAG TPA: TylF/MycF/NovP-related O-methyltransferase [Casimicrobiaceae bacterium]|nr:TylF/MycF/NovP-related O-methyltransferase [Casimicrobiaceae bacterium]
MTLETLRGLYLDLMRDCLTGIIYDDPPLEWKGDGVRPFDPKARELVMDWPARAHSMIGQKRMLQLQRAAELVLEREIPGDFVETGVWRGGACILLRAVLKAHGVTNRRVLLADSFAGLPPPDPEHYPADRGDTLYTYPALAVTLETVRENFARYGLLDDQVVFLKGWFRDTLPKAPIDRLAILRLDGDLYESTMQPLVALYDKVSEGGFIIVDDYNTFANCREAVTDFRQSRGILDRIHDIDGSAVFWQRGVA